MSPRSYYKVVAENIRNRRKALDISQERLAYMAAVDRTYLGKIEKGEANPSLKILKKLSRTLKTTVSLLLTNV